MLRVTLLCVLVVFVAGESLGNECPTGTCSDREETSDMHMVQLGPSASIRSRRLAKQRLRDNPPKGSTLLEGVPFFGLEKVAPDCHSLESCRTSSAYKTSTMWIVECRDKPGDNVCNKDSVPDAFYQICNSFPTVHCKFRGHEKTKGLPILTTNAPIDDLLQAIQNAEMPLFVQYDTEMVDTFPQGNKKRVSEATDCWNLDRIDDRDGLDLTYDDGLASEADQAGIDVYVVDSGLDYSLTEFSGRVTPCLESDTGGLIECSPTDFNCAADVYGHGTMVASILGGSTHGVAKNVMMHSAKMGHCVAGTGCWQQAYSLSGFAIAIDWVISHGSGPRIISASWVWAGSDDSLQSWIEEALDNDIVTVVAAGHSSSGGQDVCQGSATGEVSAAYITAAVTVSASNKINTKWPNANYGSCVDMFAPGKNVCVAVPQTSIYYPYFGCSLVNGAPSCTGGEGSSCAVPHVTAAIAINMARYPTATSASVKDATICHGSAGVLDSASIGDGSPNLVVYTGPLTESTTCYAMLDFSSVTTSPPPTTTQPATTTAPPTTTQPATTTAPPTTTQPATTTTQPASTTAPPTTTLPVHAVGDPHITNVLGQRFDLLQPGNHVFLLIPRNAHAQDTLLRVLVEVNHIGNACSDMYIQSLNITGKWADDNLDHSSYYAQEDAGRKSTNWMNVGKVDLKVVWGHTVEGIKYLNLFARKLGQTGFPVGGLLGEDDHTTASTPNPSCKKTDVLIQTQDGVSQAQSMEVHGGSTAEASFS